MMPHAPAAETAEASWLRAIHPIGACTIGMETPRSLVTRFLSGSNAGCIGQPFTEPVGSSQDGALLNE